MIKTQKEDSTRERERGRERER